MKYSLEQIIQEAIGKQIVIFTIPVAIDFKQYAAIGEAPLSKRLKLFAQRYQIIYLDLLPCMYEYNNDFASYYHPCDGHWNEYGNFVAYQCSKYALEIYQR